MVKIEKGGVALCTTIHTATEDAEARMVLKGHPGRSSTRLVKKMEMHGLDVIGAVLEDARFLHETMAGGGLYRGRGFETLSRKRFCRLAR